MIDPLRRWRYSPVEPRDLRLDLLRGYCVFLIAINHLATFPAWTVYITGGGRLWVSGAEGFVLISGLVLGALYRRRSVERGWAWSIAHVLRRSAALYLLAVVGHWLFSTGDYLLRAWRGRVTDLPANYFDTLINVVFHVRYYFEGFDLLPLYALLLPWGLGAVYLLQRGRWKWVLLISAAIWGAWQIDRGALVVLRLKFPFAIWQFLFISGVVAGFYRAELGRGWRLWPCRRARTLVLIGGALAILLVSFQMTYGGLWSDVEALQTAGPVFTRVTLAPGRIVAAMWVLAGLYALLTLGWAPVQRLIGWLLLPLGQHALTAYVWQAVIAYVVLRLPNYPFPGHDEFVMTAAHVMVVLVVWTSVQLTVKARRRLARFRRRRGTGGAAEAVAPGAQDARRH